MRAYRSVPLLSAILLSVVPTLVAAQETGRLLYQFAGLMNVLVGLMLAAGILLFGGGAIQYLSHLGMDEREDGLHLMTWGVTTLFALSLLIGISQFVQHNLTVTIYALGALIAAGILWFIVSEASKKEEKKPEKK